MSNSFAVEENDKHALHFALHLSRFFRSRCVWIFRVRLMLPSTNACLIIARVQAAYFPRFAQSLMLLFCGIYREITSGQIHDFK
jgi:hypothetical protein